MNHIYSETACSQPTVSPSPAAGYQYNSEVINSAVFVGFLPLYFQSLHHFTRNIPLKTRAFFRFPLVKSLSSEPASCDRFFSCLIYQVWELFCPLSNEKAHSKSPHYHIFPQMTRGIT